MSVQLFNGTLPAAFTPSKPLQVAANTVTLQWQLVVTSVTAAVIQFYLEFTDGDPNDKNTQWFREVDEQDTGNGVVLMSEVVRKFQVNGGGDLPAATYGLDTQFTRRAQFARVQLMIAVGAGSATLTAPFGVSPVS